MMDWPTCQFSDADKKETLRTLGMDNGGGQNNELEILYTERSFLIVRSKGYSGWAGVGLTAYYPAEYGIVEMYNKRSDGCFSIKVLHRKKPGKKWRDCVKRMIDLVKEL